MEVRDYFHLPAGRPENPYPFNRRLGDPREGLEVLGEEKSTCSYRDYTGTDTRINTFFR
jgi:hypothetical protein